MESEFDDYAGNYDAALNQGLALSGEPKEYFARERVRWRVCLGLLAFALLIVPFPWRRLRARLPR